MCSQDSFGLIAYKFEPEYSAEELEEIESIATGRYGENTVDDDFCTCLNCAIMSSTRENVCCRESKLVLPNLDSYDCITDHPNFETIVLNPMVLEVSFIQMMVYKGHRGRAPDQLSNKQYRLAAYRQFVCWMLCGEKLGKGNRVVIPSCVVKSVREKFPEANEDYTGFKSAFENNEDLFQL